MLQSKFGNIIQVMYTQVNTSLNFYRYLHALRKRVLRIFENILEEDDIQELIILQRTDKFHKSEDKEIEFLPQTFATSLQPVDVNL